jgi:hypothetical protein
MANTPENEKALLLQNLKKHEADYKNALDRGAMFSELKELLIKIRAIEELIRKADLNS